MNRKVLIIGLDGATFDVLNPLMEEGWMPNLKKLIENGVSCSLQSTIPPISGPAWLSLATGLNPGKTGFFDFLKREMNGFRLRAINSKDFAGRSIWDYLSSIGKRVIILNYPLLRPPYKINGYMISGLGSSPDEEFTYPKKLKQKLNKILGAEYEITIPYHDPKYNDTDLFIKDLYRVFNKKVKVSEYLLTKEKWDFFWVVFSETDWLQHLMWRHIDEKHLLHEGENSEKYKQAFKEFWGKIDEVIGQFYRIVGDKVNIIVLSDHGFGLNDQVFKLNAWLEHEGYLLRKKQRRKTLNLIKGGAYMFLKAIAKKITLVRLFPGLYERGRKIISNLSVNVLDEIDLDKSVAFDPGHTIPMGGIYINSCLVTTPQARERLIAEIRAKLKEWGNQHGLKVKTWTFSGESTGPDLLIEINNWRCVMLKDQFEGELFEQRPYSLRHTGSHRMNGIFIANGPDIANIIIEKKIQICDITPTLLYFFNLPIPKIIDGRILKEIFNYEYLKKHSNRWNNDFLQRINQIGGKLTEKEEKALRQKLKDLGYM